MIDVFKSSMFFLQDQLPAGNYSLQIRAISLAGKGEWTKPKFYIIEDDTQRDLSYLNTFFIVAICKYLKKFIFGHKIYQMAESRIKINQTSFVPPPHFRLFICDMLYCFTRVCLQKTQPSCSNSGSRLFFRQP